MRKKTISELLDAVEKTKQILTKAQTDYDTAKAELASSPLLAEAGLQVIGSMSQDGTLTQRDAILKALSGGEEMSKAEITTKAIELYGGTIARDNIPYHLAKLKKEKVITNPNRGHYQLAK